MADVALKKKNKEEKRLIKVKDVRKKSSETKLPLPESPLIILAVAAVMMVKIVMNVVSCAYYLIDMCACVWREEVELVQRAGMAVSHQKIKYCFNLYTSSVLCIMNANVC